MFCSRLATEKCEKSTTTVQCSHSLTLEKKGTVLDGLYVFLADYSIPQYVFQLVEVKRFHVDFPLHDKMNFIDMVLIKFWGTP